MELEYLCEFVAVVDCGSFSRAAEKICISQSSLSKHIMALERELGLKLIDRKPRLIELTPSGAQLLPLARQAQALSEALAAAVRKERHRGLLELQLATVPEMAQYGLTAVLSRFRKAYPEVELIVTECEKPADALAGLASGRFELAFSRRVEDDYGDLDYLRFRPDKVAAVLPAGHRLSGERIIPLKALEHERFYLLDRTTGLHDLCVRLCRETGFSPNVVYTGSRPENILGMVAQEMGVALLMRRHADFLNYVGTVCVDIEPTIDSPICLVRHGGRPLSRVGRLFWDAQAKEVEGLSFEPVPRPQDAEVQIL